MVSALLGALSWLAPSPAGATGTPGRAAGIRTTAVASSWAPSPPRIDCWSAFGSFGVANEPPACWRPYSPTSPFNRPLPADSLVHRDSAAIVARLTGFGTPQDLQAGKAGTHADFDRPLYFSGPTDPSFTLHCTRRAWGRCAIEGLRVRIPDRARPAGGDDAHLSIIDQASGWEYDLWRVSSKPRGGGTLRFSFGGRTPIYGSGLGSAAVAARYGTAAGILRAAELASGHIDHALVISVNCDSGRVVYPASRTGARCNRARHAPAMGMRFRLALSDRQIDSLRVPSWKKTILRAMAMYGMIVGDTGGSSWRILLESSSSQTSFGAPDPWVRLARQVRAPYYARDRDYVLRMAGGVDYARYLRVVEPCASRGGCAGARAARARHASRPGRA